MLSYIYELKQKAQWNLLFNFYGRNIMHVWSKSKQWQNVWQKTISPNEMQKRWEKQVKKPHKWKGNEKGRFARIT